MTSTSGTRGIRNNNPGNIDFNKANDWQGQLGKEPGPNGRFAIFDSPENGIRALGKLLQTYERRYALDTPREIITRWAPGTENDTDAYIKSVAQSIGCGPDDKIKLKDPESLTGLVSAIIKHENAGFSYPPAILAEGIKRALA